MRYKFLTRVKIRFIFFIESTESMLISREAFNCSASENGTSCSNIFNSDPKRTWVHDKNNSSWVDVHFQRAYNISKVRIDGNVDNTLIELALKDSKPMTRTSLKTTSSKYLEFHPQILVDSMNISFSKNNKEPSMIVIKEIRFYSYFDILRYIS